MLADRLSVVSVSNQHGSVPGHSWDLGRWLVCRLPALALFLVGLHKLDPALRQNERYIGRLIGHELVHLKPDLVDRSCDKDVLDVNDKTGYVGRGQPPGLQHRALVPVD